MEASVVWRALERPGHEHCRLWTNGLEGEVVVVLDGIPCVFTYREGLVTGVGLTPRFG